MPTYTYEVIKTGKTFEMEQKMSARPLKFHPKTGQPVRRIISSFAFATNRFDKTLDRMIKEDEQKAEIKAEKKTGKKRKKKK